MSAAQVPALPDPASLAGLDPPVAFAFLAVVALAIVAFYIGPALRARLMSSSREAPEPSTPSGTGPLPPALPAVMDRADAATERLVGHLERQLVERDRTIADQDRDLERLRLDVERLRDQIQWRRGNRDESA